jgi:hypothetical protein
MNKPPSGYVGLAIGQVEVALNFGRFVLDDFAFDYLYIENLEDPHPITGFNPEPTVRTRTDGKVTGVTIELAAAPDTGNYILRWGLA